MIQNSDEVLAQLPLCLRRMTMFERNHLHNVQYFYGDSEFDARYLPQNAGAFQLSCFWIDRRHFFVYGCQSSLADELSFQQCAGHETQILFPVHPVYVERYRHFLSTVYATDAAEDGLCLWAVPTASTRTLLVWPDQQPQLAFFVKLSLHERLSGERQVYRRNAARSVGLSNLVQASTAELPTGLAYMPERLAFIPRRLPDAGVIVRSIPQEVKEGKLMLAPLFSLIGGENRHTPLFLTMIEMGRTTAEELLEGVICTRFARLWLQTTMNVGLMLESHGQDLMLGLSPQFIPSGGFFYRDLEGLGVDWQLRRISGLAEPADMPFAGSWPYTYTFSETRWGSLMSQVMRWSLNGYLHYWLNELDLRLIQWKREGLLSKAVLERDTVTMMFSRKIMEAMHDLFCMERTQCYNIYYSQQKFMKLLLRLRSRLLVDRQIV